MNTKVSTFILLALLVLTACGKKNESGRQNGTGYNGTYPFSNPYGTLTNPNSPYSMNGVSLTQVMQFNPCVGGFGGYMGQVGMNTANQRIPIQVQMTNFPSVIAPNDIYVGVTSFGDVATVVGRPAGQPPLFVGYLCPRNFTQAGAGQLMDVKIGSYTQCLFKPITAAVVILPDQSQVNFRMLDFGTSTGVMQGQMQKFPFCR